MYFEQLYRVIPNDTRVLIYEIQYDETTKLIFDGYIQKVDAKLMNKVVISVEGGNYHNICIFLDK